MKNKIKFSLVCLACFIIGCDENDGYNPTKCRQVVIEQMKSTEVQMLPRDHYKYIIRLTNGEIWYAECGGFKAEITSKTLVFSPK